MTDELRPVMVITGASRGIGAAVARAAAPAYDLVLNYSSNRGAADALAAELSGTGARVIAEQADVADENAVVSMFTTVDEHFGRVDVLVNNAGVAGAHGGLDTVTGAMLQHLWAVNVTGAFLCAREATARMRTDRGGRGGSVVNISSKAAVLGGPFEWVHYAASKGAIDTMTTGLAKELGAVGVRVNAVRPGLIATDFHDIAPPGRIDRIAPTVPLQRAGTADEVAAAVLWLCSPAASYVTGAFVDVTGGR